MITPEQHAEIRRLYFGEHWKVGTIAAALGVHHDTVRAAIAHDTRTVRRGTCRASALDPYLPFVRDTLGQYPRLRATWLFEMVRARGYLGSVVQRRRIVRTIRPAAPPTVYRRLTFLMAEEAPIDWGAFGAIRIGRGIRPLSGFVMVLSYSRALLALFTLDQTLESFLRGHVEAFAAFHGIARTLVYDHLRSAVLERAGTAIRFHPRLLELAGPYHFAPRPCTPYRANEKGKIERQIHYVRQAFFAARTFADVEDLKAQFRRWRDDIAHQRPHPEQRDRTVAEVFAEEQPRLLPLPAHPFETDVMRTVMSGKTPYVRFDRNAYSIPHTHVRRPLTLLASATTVRLIAGPDEIARHARSDDTGQTIEQEAHIAGLVAATRQANPSRRRDRLRLAVPAIATLLDDYGPHELGAAVACTLERDALGAGAIAHILETRRRQRGQKRWSPVVLLEHLVQAELAARLRHRVDRRLRDARLGRFKAIADFEWTWPTQIHRSTVERVFTLDFLTQRETGIIVAPNGLGKTMLATNLVHQAILAGHSARLITAADLILDLTGQETARALQRRLRTYLRPSLIAIDEIGYLAYDAHAADLLFQVVSRRYEQKSLVVTTTLPFKQWDTVFPNAACAVALIDRLTHHAEIITMVETQTRVSAGF